MPQLFPSHITFESRWADSRADRLPTLAAEQVKLKLDVIATGGAPSAEAAKRATNTIPIVMATGSDPVTLVALTAFREVESSVANERLLALQLPLEQKAVADRTEAVRIATMQYKAGRRDLLWVPQLQTAQLATAADLIKVQSAQRVNRVRLHQVLGGSFELTPAATALGSEPTQ